MENREYSKYAQQYRKRNEWFLTIARSLWKSETVNTVCLGFSHEFSQFSQSWFYLQNRVKNVSRITYFVAQITFLRVQSYFDLSAYIYPGHVTLFGHLTRNQHFYQSQKEEAGNLNREILGCGDIKNTRFVAESNMTDWTH